MALEIYETTDPSSAFSTAGEFSNPVSITVDGVVGGSVLRRYYVRNDSNTYYYTDIQVTPVVLSGLDVVTNVNPGFTWKLIAGDTQPLDAEWDSLSGGNTIDLSDLGSLGSPDTTTYLPFWIKVDVPSGVDVQSLQGVSLQISFTETLA